MIEAGMRNFTLFPALLSAFSFFLVFPVPDLSPSSAFGDEPPRDESVTPTPLTKEEKDWLDDVAPLMTPEEKKVYVSLATPGQRTGFRDEFWSRRQRDSLHPPFGPNFKNLYERRLEVVKADYGGRKTDAGRIVLALGEPTNVIKIECAGVNIFRPIEVWVMQPVEGHMVPQRLIFFRDYESGPLRLWTPILGPEALLAPMERQSMDPHSGQLANASRDPQQMFNLRCGPRATEPSCDNECGVLWPTIIEMRNYGNLGAESFVASLAQIPAPPEGDWSQWRSRYIEGKTPESSPSSRTLTVAPAAPEASTTAAPISQEERRWIEEDVAPLASDQEKKVYLSLTAPHQRTRFQDEFWRVREKDGLKAPFGPGFRRRYEGRFEAATNKFNGWRSDAGRVVLAMGEPVAITSVDCTGIYRAMQVWTLAEAPGQAALRQLIFYRDFNGGPLKLWSPILGDDALLSPDQAAKGQSFARILGQNCDPAHPALSVCSGECASLLPAYEAVVRWSKLGSMNLVEAFTALPAPPENDWNQWKTQFVAAGSAPASTAPAVPAAAEIPTSPVRKLTRSDRSQLEKALPEKYREWLAEVDMIVTEREKDIFLQVKDSIERDKFIEEFWRRRSIDKDGVRTNFREIYRARIEYARENFKNLYSDASKVYVLNGPPDAIIPIDCAEVFVPIRIWYYERLEALRNKVYLIFYEPYGVPGDWKLWLPLDGIEKLSIRGAGYDPRAAENRCFETRTVQQAIAAENAVLGNGISGMAEATKMFVPPPVETEGIDRFLGLTTQMDAGATAIPVEKSFLFPEQKDGKIACDISVLLSRTDLALRDLGDQKFFDVDLIGEVVQNDRLLDNFKYRFDIPLEEVGGDKLPLTIRRYLYPGQYELRLKAADSNRKGEGRFVQAFRVPETPDAPTALMASASLTRNPGGAVPSGDFRPSAISILPPVRDILTGLQRFETKSAEGILAVDFYLDGTKIMTRTKGPFDADLNLGPLPRRHAIKVVAYDRQGRSVGEDELNINEGSESFRVKILAPRRGSSASGPTTVVADATAPEGHKISTMEFYSNNTKVATLFQPPWQQIVPFRKSGSLGFVRVVGTLDDGLIAEDVRYVNAPAYISEVNVDAVELYTTVTRGNRPIEGLTETNFKVFEDGKEQQIAHFEHVTNLPLTVGVAIDTSASMIENLPEAEKAAVDFIDATLGEKDRGFTMSFDDSPYTLCKLTNTRERLDRSFAGLRAEGSTALYDAIVYALYQYQGVKGKKALVLLTDGKDTSSKYEFDTLLDYVKKAGVSIYAIGLNISKAELEVKSKLNRMAEASGGSTFYIDNTKSLHNVYSQINSELRAQYLLTYYSTNPSTDNKWRHIEVKTSPTALLARTISGYYP